MLLISLVDPSECARRNSHCAETTASLQLYRHLKREKAQKIDFDVLGRLCRALDCHLLLIQPTRSG